MYLLYSDTRLLVFNDPLNLTPLDSMILISKKSTILWFGNLELSNPNCFPAAIPATLYPTPPPACIVSVPSSLAWS